MFTLLTCSECSRRGGTIEDELRTVAAEFIGGTRRTTGQDLQDAYRTAGHQGPHGC